MKKLNKKGFTLTEILAVVVIVGLLAGLITAGVLRYVNSGKEEYNDKLKKQLVLSGKTYYSNNKDKLPTSNIGKMGAVVSLPEMQSKNYITNDFVDSEGRECSPSYVYVRRASLNSNDYNYYGCLICQDEQGNVTNHSSDDMFCQKVPSDNSNAPICKYSEVYGYDASSNIQLEEVSDDGQIMAIELLNKTTGETQYIDTSSMSNTEIIALNLNDKFKQYIKTDEKAQYEIKLIDDSFNYSDTCISFQTSSTGECHGERQGENVTISATSTIGIQSVFYTLPDGTKQMIRDYTSPRNDIDGEFFDNVPHDATVFVQEQAQTVDRATEGEDETGYDARLPEPIECDLEENLEGPVCTFVKQPSSSYKNSEQTLQVKCEAQEGQEIKLDSNWKNMISNKNDKYGSLPTSKMSYKESPDHKSITFTIVHKPAYNKSEDKGVTGKDKVILEPGIVSNKYDDTLVNSKTVSNDVFVDTKKPSITFSIVFGGSGSYTKSTNKGTKYYGFKNKVKVKVKCTDSGSGVKTLWVKKDNGSWTKKSGKSGSVTFKTQGKHTIHARCRDKLYNKSNAVSSGLNKQTEKSKSSITVANKCSKTDHKCALRVIKKVANCSKCGWASKKCIATKGGDCSSSCTWTWKGKDGSTGTYGKCDYEGQTYYNSGATGTCHCTNSCTASTCTAYGCKKGKLCWW